ncbi:hypothetical protein [Gracilibacillus phocaeensis]|uniref:hypothetical protein n=1 Tax=Gracilibacillus phocaeensis TaxID=2042304 RepID=UPI0013EF2B36|nr:hypothetical protein [Gracilibacillus phocaeensis]
MRREKVELDKWIVSELFLIRVRFFSSGNASGETMPIQLWSLHVQNLTDKKRLTRKVLSVRMDLTDKKQRNRKVLSVRMNLTDKKRPTCKVLSIRMNLAD